MDSLSDYTSKSGSLDPVWTLEVQTLPEDVDRILDAVMRVWPLHYGRYQRNASVSAVGYETAEPEAGSTTHTHVIGFAPGGRETYPMVELKITVPRDLAVLDRVMSAVLEVHHYEEPVIFVREDFVSRAAYDPNRDNPHRWWNNGKGLPARLDQAP